MGKPPLRVSGILDFGRGTLADKLFVRRQPFERLSADVAAGFEASEQQVEVQHSALRTERVQHALYVKRR